MPINSINRELDIVLKHRKLANDTCYYCGADATCRDHPTPVVYDATSRLPTISRTLPCCHPCNQSLGTKTFDSLVDRRRYLFDRQSEKLTVKLKKLDWSIYEFLEMGYNIQTKILGALDGKAHLISRLINLKSIKLDPAKRLAYHEVRTKSDKLRRCN
jgi:hypothetical protein